jgi:hypothetical protein
MLRFMVCVCALAVASSIAAVTARAQSADPPPAVTAAGAASMPLAGQATRVHLLGLVEIYTLAVYMDAPLSDRARLLSSDVPKALRIEIRYNDDLPLQVPTDWRRELVPPLNPAAIAHLRGTFAPLKRGDVVSVEYVPGKGTTARVNKAVVVSGANHDLIVAFLDHWLGQRPVSEEMKQGLMGGGDSDMLRHHVRHRAGLQGKPRGNRRPHAGARQVPEEVLRVGALSRLGPQDPS